MHAQESSSQGSKTPDLSHHTAPSWAHLLHCTGRANATVTGEPLALYLLYCTSCTVPLALYLLHCTGRTNASKHATNATNATKQCHQCHSTSWTVPGEPMPASMGMSLAYGLMFASGANPGLKPRALREHGVHCSCLGH